MNTTLTVGGTSIEVRALGSKPRVTIRRRPNLAAQQVYGASKDDVEHMGNRGRAVTISGAVLYDDAVIANPATWVAALNAWCDAGTAIAFVSQTEAGFNVKIDDLTIIEGSGQGFEYALTAVEV